MLAPLTAVLSSRYLASPFCEHVMSNSSGLSGLVLTRFASSVQSSAANFASKAGVSVGDWMGRAAGCGFAVGFGVGEGVAARGTSRFLVTARPLPVLVGAGVD